MQNKDDWPESLKSFIRDSHCLSLPRTRCDKYEVLEINKDIKRGMIPKKIAEVASLSAVVDTVCTEDCCEGIVDVGAGLVSRFLLLRSIF
jgi:hypothetical protein